LIDCIFVCLGTLEPRSLPQSEADSANTNMTFCHISHHAEFARSQSNNMVVRKDPPPFFLGGGRWEPAPGMGRGWSRRKKLLPHVLHAKFGRSRLNGTSLRMEKWTRRVPPVKVTLNSPIHREVVSVMSLMAW